jgi:hypothetical protein
MRHSHQPMSQPRSQMRLRLFVSLALMVMFIFMLAPRQVQAAVNVFLSAGNTCTGGNTANFSTSGPTFQVSVCVTNTGEAFGLCGHTLKLRAANAGEAGRFQINPRTLGANYADPNNTVIAYPIAINNPANIADLGGTTASTAPFAPAANQLLATFDLVPQASATNASYTISTSQDSILAVDTDGTCANAADLSAPASMTLSLVIPTFTVTPSAGANGSISPASPQSVNTGTSTQFTVTPNLGFSAVVTGTCGGNLSGNIYTTNAITSACTVIANFISAPIAQTINMAATPASLLNNASPFTVSATATSGLTVSFTSLTPSICTSTGSNGATIGITGALGTCTIRASQAGNTTYLAAPAVDRNISIVSVPPVQTTAVASLSSSLTTTPAAHGTPFTLNGQIVGNAPSGTATFSLVGANSSTVICADVILTVSGTASCSVPLVYRSAGTNTYRLDYAGDSNNTSANTTLEINIVKASVVLTLTASPVKPIVGQAIILTALIGADDTSGIVTFKSGNNIISGCDAVSVAPLPVLADEVTGKLPDADAAVANCILPAAMNASAGNKQVSVEYAGSANNLPANASLTLEIFADGPAIDYADMWWAGASENGWGLSIAQKGKIQFNAFYIYDNTGKPIWTVMPGGTWNSDYTVFKGLLYQPTSAPFTNYDVSQFKPGASIGEATLTFTSATTATFSYTINGVTAVKQIVRQPFGTTDTKPRIIVNDLWWAGDKENGWGINIAQQARTLFMVWYTYGQDGKTTWMTVPGGSWSGTTFTGDIYNTTGSAWLGVNFDASQLRVNKVGKIVLDFEDANRAVMTYTVDGVTQTKVITRQPF